MHAGHGVVGAGGWGAGGGWGGGVSRPPGPPRPRRASIRICRWCATRSSSTRGCGRRGSTRWCASAATWARWCRCGGGGGGVGGGRRRVRRAGAYLRLSVLPGEQAQADWGSFGTIEVGRMRRPLSCFVMVLSWSRAIDALFTLDQTLESFLRGHVHAFSYFAAVPRVIP